MTASQSLMQFAKGIQESINTCLPARVVKVNEDGTVNVVAIRNDEIEDCVITVPVIRPETQRAYIQLKINVGDRGIVKFCDKSIEDYRLTGTEYYNGDDRIHSISDGVFQLGFLPNNEKFLYPEGEIVIGLKNGECIIVVDEAGNLTVKSKLVTINSPVIINGDTTVNGETTMNGNLTVNANIKATGTISSDTDVLSAGISGLSHTHIGNLGNPTSSPQ